MKINDFAGSGKTNPIQTQFQSQERKTEKGFDGIIFAAKVTVIRKKGYETWNSRIRLVLSVEQ